MPIPTYLYYGDLDVLADHNDVYRLKGVLKNLVAFEEIKGCDHLDFVWGLNAAPDVYSKVLLYLKS